MKYTHRWIGRKGSVARPPRSSDLTLLDYFLEIFIFKGIVLSELPITRDRSNYYTFENIQSKILKKTRIIWYTEFIWVVEFKFKILNLL